MCYGEFFTLYAIMDSSFWFDMLNTWDGPLYISRGHRLIFFKNRIFFSKDPFCLSKQ